jgi:cell division protein FtsZ
MVNAPRAPERPMARKGDVSLFERITGVRRADKRPATPPHMTEPTLVQPAPVPRSVAPSPVAAPVPPAVPVHEAVMPLAESRTPPASEPQPAAAPLLGAIEPDDRLTISQEDDDPLDIPAFLRRQAN